MTQDSVMIAVDSRPDPERSANLRLDDSTRRDLAQMAVGFRHARGIVEESYYLRFLEASRAAVASKCNRHGQAGYDVEFKVDGAFLDQHAGEALETVRSGHRGDRLGCGRRRERNPLVREGFRRRALHWTPDRFGEAPVAASGTFARSTER